MIRKLKFAGFQVLVFSSGFILAANLCGLGFESSWGNAVIACLTGLLFACLSEALLEKNDEDLHRNKR